MCPRVPSGNGYPPLSRATSGTGRPGEPSTGVTAVPAALFHAAANRKAQEQDRGENRSLPWPLLTSTCPPLPRAWDPELLLIH